VGGVAVADELGDSTFDLPREVVSAATAFETYMTTAAQVNSFSSGDSVEQGLRSGVSYQPAQLEEGMIAYGALAALRDDAFVEGVQRAAADEASRQALSDRLVDSPNDALQLDGSAEALQHISEALDARAEPLVAAGAEVKSAAYSVQHQAWSKVMVDDAQGRLAEVKQLSAARFEPKDSDYQDMLKTLATTDAGAGSGEAAPGGATDVEIRALALAAEVILGRAHGEDSPRMASLLSEPRSAECLKMAKLNLYQCMAVAGPQYEDIFCLGQHAMADTGTCVADAAHGHSQAPAGLASASPVERASYLPLAAHRTLRIDPDQ
jgi:hypothetical protein